MMTRSISVTFLLYYIMAVMAETNLKEDTVNNNLFYNHNRIC